MSKSKHREIARQTVDILDKGFYRHPNGNKIFIADAMAKAKAGTRLYRPDELAGLMADLQPKGAGAPALQVEVCNETTFSGARRLLAEGEGPVMALNFASAKNPGGGFLGGAQAQEEALCRASGLYPCLLEAPEYYRYHRSHRTKLYSNHMIWSPDVPVFRDDRDELLPEAYLLSFVTSPAVNAGALESGKADRIEPVMRERIAKLFAIAVTQGCRKLVLGAWGCGVFRNDPVMIAGLFREQLFDAGWGVYFDCVSFSVLDKEGGPRIKAFKEVFQTT